MTRLDMLITALAFVALSAALVDHVAGRTAITLQHAQTKLMY